MIENDIDFEVIEDSCFKFTPEHEINLNNTVRLMVAIQHVVSKRPGYSGICIDLKNSENIDSAGIFALYNISSKWCKPRGLKLKLKNIPDSFKKILTLFQIDRIEFFEIS